MYKYHQTTFTTCVFLCVQSHSMVLLHPVLKITPVHIHFFIALLRSKKCSDMSPHFPSNAQQGLAGCMESCFLFMKQFCLDDSGDLDLTLNKLQ